MECEVRYRWVNFANLPDINDSVRHQEGKLHVYFVRSTTLLRVMVFR